MKKKFLHQLGRKLNLGVRVASVLALMANLILPGFQAFATAGESGIYNWDYVWNEATWNASHESGTLKVYYQNNPSEDLWNANATPSARKCNFNDQVYTALICDDSTCSTSNNVELHTTWGETYQTVNDGENSYLLTMSAEVGSDDIYELYQQEALCTIPDGAPAGAYFPTNGGHSWAEEDYGCAYAVPFERICTIPDGAPAGAYFPEVDGGHSWAERNYGCAYAVPFEATENQCILPAGAPAGATITDWVAAHPEEGCYYKLDAKPTCTIPDGAPAGATITDWVATHPEDGCYYKLDAVHPQIVSSGKYVKLISSSYSDDCQPTYQGWIANGAKAPWISIAFEENFEGTIKFNYADYNEGADVYPRGEDARSWGPDEKAWAIASIPEEFGNDYLVNEGVTTFNTEKFTISLVPATESDVECEGDLPDGAQIKEGAGTYTKTWNITNKEWDAQPSWTYNGAQCGYECDSTHHRDAEANAGAGACVENSDTHLCTPVAEADKVEGATYDETEMVEITWEGSAWSTPATCKITACAGDNHPNDEGSVCVSNTKSVDCTNPDPLDENAEEYNTQESVTWNEGWPETPTCTVKTCKANYNLEEGVCVSIYTPAGDIVVPQEGTTAQSATIATPIDMTAIEMVESEGDIQGTNTVVLQETKGSAAISEEGTTEATIESELATLVTDVTKTADMKGIVDIQFIQVSSTGATSDINEKVNFNKPVAIKIPVPTGITSVKVRVKHTGETTYGTGGLTTDQTATCNTTNGTVNEVAKQYDGGDVAVVNNIAVIYTCSASSFVAYAEVNKSTPSGGSSGGGGGSSSYSCKNLPDNAVANNTTKPTKSTNYSYSTDTSKVCTFQCKSGYAWNEKDAKCELSESATTGDNTGVDSDSTDNTDASNISDEDRAAADAQALKDGYSQEFIDAYNFARKNNITTMNTIREANMDAPLTRIAMAKMLSQYAINVLGKTPDTTKVVPNFPDVDAKLDADYNNGVTLAYQLGIMGIGIENFRPFDEVTRAEFGTALSRMLFGLADGEGAEWYKTHLDKLMNEKIITNDNPNLKELRGYVMIMLMRSAQ